MDENKLNITLHPISPAKHPITRIEIEDGQIIGWNGSNVPLTPGSTDLPPRLEGPFALWLSQGMSRVSTLTQGAIFTAENLPSGLNVEPLEGHPGLVIARDLAQIWTPQTTAPKER